MAPLPKSVEIIAEHVLTQLNNAKNRPLFVALQGPQGSGKSYTADLLAVHLSAPPHALRVAQLSIDDLYLPHDALVALAKTGNPLWRGRGQPGTHDVELGVQLLTKLKEGKDSIELPRFEKSLFNGEGDRLPMDGTGPIVQPPVDVVLLEGWCTGFYPITIEELEQRWDSHWREERVRLNLEDNELGTMDHVIAINDALKKYVKLWEFFDVFVQLVPAPTEASPYAVIYKWRLEQEHNMKAKNGGKGMTDEAVKKFVDRYIPGYVFFSDGVTDGLVGKVEGVDVPFKAQEAPAKPSETTSITTDAPSEDDDRPRQPTHPPSWRGRGLRLIIAPDRSVVGMEHF
ncbi:P-loop containing nucleoside triphosphate hydrolase protein [Schizophyllum commune]